MLIWLNMAYLICHLDRATSCLVDLLAAFSSEELNA